MLNNSEYMDAPSKTYDDFAQLRRRVITPAVMSLKIKAISLILRSRKKKGIVEIK